MKKILFIIFTALFVITGCNGDITSESVGSGSNNGGNSSGGNGNDGGSDGGSDGGNGSEHTGPKYQVTAEPANITLNKDDLKSINSIKLTFEPVLESNEYIYYEPKDTNIIKMVGSGNEKMIRGVAIGSTFLRIGVSGKAGSYVDIPVIVKDASEPEPVIYPDDEPSDAGKYPKRVYLKVKFDAYSNSGDLYNEQVQSGIQKIVFTNYKENCSGAGLCSGELENKNKGFVYPAFGYCEKYGCINDLNNSANNKTIAKKKQGTTYYFSHNNLYITYTGQKTQINHPVYIVFETASSNAYVRLNDFAFPINWADYDENVYRNIAKFTITMQDQVPTVVFDGFEPR